MSPLAASSLGTWNESREGRLSSRAQRPKACLSSNLRHSSRPKWRTRQPSSSRSGFALESLTADTGEDTGTKKSQRCLLATLRFDKRKYLSH